MDWLTGWWNTVPSWAKPPLLVAGIGLLAWVLQKGLPAVKRLLYINVLTDMEVAKKKCLLQLIKEHKGTSILIQDDEIIKHVKWPAWLIRRARRWEANKKRFG